MSLVELQAVAFNLGIRMIPVATKLTYFVAEVAGVSTLGLGVAAGGRVAVGIAAERALPPGVSAGNLLTAVARLSKDVVIGSYRFVAKAVSGTGRQANHINQKAAFPNAAIDDMLSVSLEGSVNSVGSQHWQFHNVLENFWSAFRAGGPRYGQVPTNAEYGAAMRQALTAAGQAADDLARLAEQERRALGYFDGPGGLAPVVPAPIPGFVKQ